MYGGFESGCGRRNILALRLCAEAEPGGASAPPDSSKNIPYVLLLGNI